MKPRHFVLAALVAVLVPIPCLAQSGRIQAGGPSLDGEAIACELPIAEHLRNTRAVCRASYVHPSVIEAFHAGELGDAWQRSRRTERMRRAERATLAVLGDG